VDSKQFGTGIIPIELPGEKAISSKGKKKEHQIPTS
jgi:hypothetical protein